MALNDTPILSVEASIVNAVVLILDAECTNNEDAVADG